MSDRGYTGLSALPKVKDKQHFNELAEVYDTLSLLAEQMNNLMYSIPADTFAENLQRLTVQNLFGLRVKVTETIPAGAVVDLLGSGGRLVATHEDNNNYFYEGIMTEAVTANNVARFCFFGLVSGYSGLTPGQVYKYQRTASWTADDLYGPVVALTPTTVFIIPP